MFFAARSTLQHWWKVGPAVLGIIYFGLLTDRTAILPIIAQQQVINLFPSLVLKKKKSLGSAALVVVHKDGIKELVLAFSGPSM